MKGSYRAYGGEWYEPRLIRRLAAPFPTTARISLGLCSFRFSAAEDLARSASFPPSIRRRPWGQPMGFEKVVAMRLCHVIEVWNSRLTDHRTPLILGTLSGTVPALCSRGNRR